MAMKPDEFDETLRKLLRRKPFFPFTVVLVDGTRLDIDGRNGVAFNQGAAAYISAKEEITFFDCEQVKEIITPTPETAA